MVKKKTIERIPKGFNPFMEAIKAANTEAGVRIAYLALFNSIFDNAYEYEKNIRIDGVIEDPEVKAICEFKDQKDLKGQGRIDALTQVVYYLKNLENRAFTPKVVFVGDRDECFILPVSKLTKYLDTPNADWTIAPSIAATDVKNPIHMRISVDVNDLQILTYDIDDNFKNHINAIVEKMKSIQRGNIYLRKVTKDNLPAIFTEFQKDIIKDKKYQSENIPDAKLVDLVDIFFAIITDRVSLTDNILSLHEVGSGKRGRSVKINVKKYSEFRGNYETRYTDEELKILMENKDRALEEVRRRRSGAYFTPSLWVAEAHKMIADVYGADWKEKFVVWDCAAGTANLTRDYDFNELYISTLDKGDIDSIVSMGFNPNAKKFVYDFLNDGDEKLPKELVKAFEDGKPVLFLINPPYGQATEFGKKSKAGVANNKIGREMLNDGFTNAGRNLYAQFLYRIMKLQEKYKNINIAIFAPPLYYSGDSFNKFRNKFFTKFEFKDGMLFQASEFSDVSEQWGISFSILNGVKCSL